MAADRSRLVVERDDVAGMASAPRIDLAVTDRRLVEGIEAGARVRFTYTRRAFGSAHLTAMEPAGPGPAEVHDHTPHHGGVVVMVGERHVEARATPAGRVEVWLTDFFRKPIDVAALHGTALLDADADGRSVDLVPEGDALVGQGPPIGGPRTAARFTIATAEGSLTAAAVLPVAAGSAGAPSVAQTRCTPDDAAGARCAIRLGQPVTALAVSPDGGTLVVAAAGGAVTVWRLPEGSLVGGIDPAPPIGLPRGEAPHAETVSRIAWRPDGGEMALVLEGRLLRYALPSGRLVRVLGDPGRLVREVAWWPDGTRIVTAARADPEAHVVDVDTGRITVRYEVKLEGSAILVEPAAETVLVGSEAGTITRFRAKDAKRLDVFAASSAAVVSLARSGDRLLVLTATGSLRTLDAGDGAPIAILAVGATTARFAVDERGRVAVGLPSGRVVVTNTARDAIVRTLDTSAAAIVAVAWAGSTLVTGDAAGRVALWPLAD